MSTKRPIVGRDNEIQLIRRVLDGQGKGVISASGVAGIGKTTLLNCAVEAAEERDLAVVVFNLSDPGDGSGADVVSLIRLVARRSEAPGAVQLTTTRRAFDRYEDARQAVLAKFAGNEPEVGELLRFGIEAARAGLGFVPGASAAQQALTPELAAAVLGAVRAHGDRDERRLLEDPAHYLGAALVEDCTRAATRGGGLFLAFDEYEHVTHEVDGWLRRMLAGYFAALPAHTVAMIAGRLPLGPNWLGGAQGVPEITRLEVDDLTTDAVVSYLKFALAGVDAEDTAVEIAAMLGPLGRLPVLLERAASDPGRLVEMYGSIGHPSEGYDWGAALEHYVDRLAVPTEIAGRQRLLLRMLAIPRRLDAALARVVLDVLDVDADLGSTSFDAVEWLGREDFFNAQAPAFTMYEPVRRVLMGSLRQHDPELLRRAHAHLAEEYERRATAAVSDRERVEARREQTYHAALAGAESPVAVCLQGLLDCLPGTYLDLPQWATALSDLQHSLPSTDAAHRRELARLSEALTLSWTLLTPSEVANEGGASSWLTDLLLYRLLRLDPPEITTETATYWLELFVVRTKRLSQVLDRLLEAADSLLRGIYRRSERDFADDEQSLLKLCVAYELAEVSQLQGRTGQAVFWSQRSIDHLPSDATPLLTAMTRAGLATNLKRSTEYRQAIRQFEESIACFRHLDGSWDEHLSSMQLELANCHAYLGEVAKAGSLLAELDRKHIDGHREAELRHRVGWQLRLAGDLDASHQEHEAAVREYDVLLETHPVNDQAGAFTLQTLRAKARHSWANTLTEMHRFTAAHDQFTQAIKYFDSHGMRRHAAIAMKDFTRCLPELEDFEKCAAVHEEALGLLDVGKESSYANSDHIADGCLSFSRLALIEGRPDQAIGALDTARSYIDHLEREARNLLEARWHLERAFVAALSSDPSAAHEYLPRVSSYANRANPIRHDLLALVETARAIVSDRTDESNDGSSGFQRARDLAANWNPYLRFDLEQLWLCAVTLGEPSVRPVEMLDVYDADGTHVGTESSQVVHQDGLWHHTFHLWLTDVDEVGRLRLVFQRRGPDKRDYPGFLDISIAGHYKSGEGIDGGIREAREELGVEISTEQLTLLARRVVDETLYNGTVNREVQFVYWLHVDSLDALNVTIGYPEVGGIVRCRLDLFEDLLAGDIGSVRVDTWSGGSSGSLAASALVSLPDFIPEALPYLAEVCTAIRSRRDAADTLSEDRVLDDGSSWQAADRT